MFEWLEFEENVGRFWHRWVSAHSASFPSFPEAAVTLDSISGPLAVFFRAGGGPGGVAVASIAARASTHRLNLRQRLGLDEEMLDMARLDEENLLLPPRIALFDDPRRNRDLYFWLAAMLAAMTPTREFKDPLRQNLAALRQVVAATEAALDGFPGLRGTHAWLQREMLSMRPQRDLPPAEAAMEEVICHLLGAENALSAEATRYYTAVRDTDMSLREYRAPQNYRQPLPVPLWANLNHLGTAVGFEAEDDDSAEPPAPASEQIQDKRKAERRRQDQSERDDPLVFNRFEKILSFAEMVNVNRMVDEDEDEHAKSNAEQMDEITLSPNQQRAASQLKMDLDLSPGAVAEGQLTGEHTYPEWNFRKQRYQPGHCRVLSGVHEEEGDHRAHDEQTRRRIRRVRQQFEALRPRREWLRGQVDGNELDMDAVVRAHCDLAAVGENSTGLYMSTRAQARDLAISILIDVSLSTDAWVEDRRVIDIEKEALLVLAHGLAACGDDYSIQSFTSHRRHRVWVNTLKSFDEPMNELTERRIAALKPGHYTRMGAAIRHAAVDLAKRPNRHRLLLVLTDGKPNDSDYYEGRYGIEDTRRAILDARRQELKVFGVTIDRDAQDYIGQLFGRGGYAMVHKPEHLSQALPGIYRQIVAS
ncbi:nitric oxide reductase activation protein NorD [Pseudohalioglobus lutimaris]|uniref:VWA domain-containing protein n=1 Tax=Pseudohalioglobus lutimaris TaxID=1737061 RepID=A0A2N5X283_9GAMM|nr:VWA domain-containing protein [Pseudohalioglobus lutimaris]PLW68604.1 VWA domain-containing protein [Pseudohalioglobus lutimaris]